MNRFCKRLQVVSVFFSVLFCISIYPELPSKPHVMFSTFTSQSRDRDCAGDRVHGDFSHEVTWDDSKAHTIPRGTNHLNSYTVQDFEHYFAERGYTESEILNQRCLYMFDEFVKCAQTYSGYKDTIRKLHAELKNLSVVQKVYCIANGTYCKRLQKRIRYLYNSLHTIKTIEQHNNISYVPSSIVYQQAAFSAQFTEYKALGSVYEAYVPSLAKAIETRSNVYNGFAHGDFVLKNTSKSYSLNHNVKQLLSQYEHETKCFAQCSGNQLQHVIHQEALDILDRIDGLPHDSLLYDHQEALIGFTAAMIEYNHDGLIDKAMSIGDLCWTLLDYGQAIAEGAALGIYSAAHDVLTNPIEATVAIVAGKQIFAFQLCKVLYNVADIGIAAIHDFEGAQEKWNKYTEPLNNIIDAINKKEITVRDAIKGGTAFVVGYKAQGKLLGGLGKFCNTIKHKSINFVKNNSLLYPQEYLTTPEGLLFKATGQSVKLGQATPSKLKNGVDDKVLRYQSIKGLLKKEGLPTKGKLRYVPPKKLRIAEGLPEKRLPDGGIGFIDRFGNVWVQGVSRTKGQPHEWDVQLSKQGIQQVGWMTRDNSHLNVSLDGRVTHK